MAENLTDIIILLEGTPFQDALTRVASEFQDTRTLFPLELAVDRCVFNRIWETINQLSKKDRDISRRLLGIEIDLKNIGWIGRLKTYYELSSAEIGRQTLPHGYRITTDDVRRIASEGSVTQAIERIAAGSQFARMHSPSSEVELKDIEFLLYQLLVMEARKAFGDFPFSIGSILGYFILLRIETRNVRTVLQAKRYGLSAERTEALMIL
jgi:V/A-type H+-transporting ATPase subunit C